MSFLSELRFPRTRLTKILGAILALGLFYLVASAMVSGFLLYHILWPPKTSSSINVDLLMGHPSTLSFSLPEGGTREGLFFPGLRGAPTIIFCHGYRSQRADILTMVTAVQEHGYNAYLFDFSGHGGNPGATTLGYKESDEVLAAIRMLAARDDVDHKRFGIWGTDLGAYSALSAAVADPRIQAIAADSAYGSPEEYLQIEVGRSGLEAIPLVVPFCRLGFDLIEHDYRKVVPLSARISRLSGVPQLYVEVSDEPRLAAATQRIYAGSPEPKQELHERASYAVMSDDGRRSYENLVANFFLTYLPAEGPR
jgi:pimeloyl-ACP methyl ester carboxylesterase